MATVINFQKDAETKRYYYEYTSDGNERVFQILFNDEESTPDRTFVDVKAKIDSSFQFINVAPVEMWGEQNKMFRVDIPSGVIVRLETYLEVSKAAFVTVDE